MERKAKVKKWIRKLGIIVGICLAICLAVRVYNIFYFARTDIFIEEDRSHSADRKFDAVLMYWERRGGFVAGDGGYVLYIVPYGKQVGTWEKEFSKPVFQAEWAEFTSTIWDSNDVVQIKYSGHTVDYLQSKWSPLMSGREVTLRLADPDTL
jgi:hypothetical protein